MVIILMGVAGSGKTTVGQLLAAQLGWPFFDADDYHSPANIAKMSAGIPLTDTDRAGWLLTLADLIRTQLRAGQPAVLACSALKQAYRDALCIDPAQVNFVYLYGSYAQIYQRLQGRNGHYMKSSLLSSQFAILEEPTNALWVDCIHPPPQITAEIRQALNL